MAILFVLPALSPRPSPTRPVTIASQPQLKAACIVPAVEGLEQSVAEGLITQLGLRIVRSSQYSAEVEAGIILLQEPKAGRRLDPCKGDMTIVVSLRPLPTLAPITKTSQLIDTPAPSQKPMYFAEEFDAPTINEALWEAEGPPIKLKNGYMTLKSTMGIFPYVYAKQNPIPPEGNFELEISFRYPTVTDRGVGFALSKTVLPYGTASAAEAIFSTWQDTGTHLYIRFMGNKIFGTTADDILQHTIELRYDGRYDILVDGSLVYSSPTTEERPSAFWFGNYVNVGGDGAWTSLEIDYIRIDTVP